MSDRVDKILSDFLIRSKQIANEWDNCILNTFVREKRIADNFTQARAQLAALVEEYKIKNPAKTVEVDANIHNNLIEQIASLLRGSPEGGKR